jgi:hypothetical protein
LQAGGAFELALTFISKADQKIVNDYEISFVKAGGKRSTKVFKLKQLSTVEGQQVNISKRHMFRANATTYRLYPGPIT